MSVIVIFVLVALTLFTSAYVAKRRFGLLGLALATGSILSGIWGYEVGIAASIAGFKSGPSTSAIILSMLILLPPSILLFHGYTYKTKIGRFVGALMFTVLAIAFLVEPIGHILVLDGQSLEIYNLLDTNKEFIIGTGLILAIFDLFFTKPNLKKSKKS